MLVKVVLSVEDLAPKRKDVEMSDWFHSKEPRSGHPVM